MKNIDMDKINNLCPVAGSFKKCINCIYQKSRDDNFNQRCGGLCRADGNAIITGLDNDGKDIQSETMIVEEL